MRIHRLLAAAATTLLLILIAGSGHVIATTVMAHADGHSNVALAGESGSELQGGYCGDSFCDPYLGENETTCPEDCAPTTTSTATATATGTPYVPSTSTSTPTATATITPLPQFTATPTPTETETPTPTPTAESEPTETPSPTPEDGGTTGECGFVSFESRSEAWREGYANTSAPEYPDPQRTDDQEVYVCRVEPGMRVCFPIYDGLLEAVSGDLSHLALIDCTASGVCKVYDWEALPIGDTICFDVPITETEVVCEEGCAIAVEKQTSSFLSILTRLPRWAQILIAFGGMTLLVALIGGLILLIILLLRRRREREDDISAEEEADDEDDPGSLLLPF